MIWFHQYLRIVVRIIFVVVGLCAFIAAVTLLSGCPTRHGSEPDQGCGGCWGHIVPDQSVQTAHSQGCIWLWSMNPGCEQ